MPKKSIVEMRDSSSLGQFLIVIVLRVVTAGILAVPHALDNKPVRKGSCFYPAVLPFLLDQVTGAETSHV